MSNIISKAQRKQKGRVLTRYDSEQKTLHSGPLGSRRLLMNIALDFQEKYPGLPWDDCLRLAFGYCDRVHGK